ncbi:hypothetical protein TWF718_001776 [Orbilia javanica]|uniref:Uncharacterized protein n=1 Tax=Orbilia javanica TaxID=47235 RepID=A0AAN8RSR8_9PEZI
MTNDGTLEILFAELGRSLQWLPEDESVAEADNLVGGSDGMVGVPPVEASIDISEDIECQWIGIQDRSPSIRYLKKKSYRVLIGIAIGNVVKWHTVDPGRPGSYIRLGYSRNATTGVPETIVQQYTWSSRPKYRRHYGYRPMHV